MKRIFIITALLVTGVTGTARAQAPIDWKAVEAETLRHFQALVRIDTSNPPGNETRAVEYLKQVLDEEGRRSTTRASRFAGRASGTVQRAPRG